MSKNYWISGKQCRPWWDAASHLSLHCLRRPVCPNTYGKYGIQLRLWKIMWSWRMDPKQKVQRMTPTKETPPPSITSQHQRRQKIATATASPIIRQLQSNFNNSNTDGSFTMVNSNSFFESQRNSSDSSRKKAWSTLSTSCVLSAYKAFFGESQYLVIITMSSPLRITLDVNDLFTYSYIKRPHILQKLTFYCQKKVWCLWW